MFALFTMSNNQKDKWLLFTNCVFFNFFAGKLFVFFQESHSWQEEESFIFVLGRRTENKRHSFSAGAVFTAAFWVMSTGHLCCHGGMETYFYELFSPPIDPLWCPFVSSQSYSGYDLRGIFVVYFCWSLLGAREFV